MATTKAAQVNTRCPPNSRITAGHIVNAMRSAGGRCDSRFGRAEQHSGRLEAPSQA